MSGKPAPAGPPAETSPPDDAAQADPGGHSIAVVGLACRYPDADDPAALLDVVLTGRRTFRRIPQGRLDLADYYSPDPGAVDATYSTRAALIEEDRMVSDITGKTGLAMRLCEDRWEATESTHGMQVTQLKLSEDNAPSGIEREVWLWDFAGQPDYRLIHQLYMDETALGVLVFDPQDDNPFEDLSHWEKALEAAAIHSLT
jgi:hypothetical protein